jgi:putative endopeptidase
MPFVFRIARTLAPAVVLALVVLGLGRGLAPRPAGAQPAPVASAPAAAATPAVPQPPALDEGPGFHMSWLDPTCKACDDFYQFATGGWRKANPIPGDYPQWGQFYVIYARSLDQLHAVVDHAAADTNAPDGSNEQKVGIFYKTCMDEAAVEATGSHPLDPEMAKVAAVTDVPSLVAEIAHLQQGVAPGTPFDFNSFPDPKNSDRIIGELSQDGLTLPERDYYLNTSAASQKLRDTYTAHVARMLQLLGDDAATSQAEAATVLALETKLAQASLTNVELRDVAKVTNHYTVDTLQAQAPAVQWATFFSNVGATQTADLNVDEPSFFKALDGLLTSVPVSDWKTYLRWRILNAAGPALPKAFVDERFSFIKVLSGTQTLPPRWKRCIPATDTAMGEALGQLYAQAYFTAAAKARALKLIDSLQDTLHDDMTTLPWMSPATRAYAIVKLTAMRKKIGYPDKPIDYTKLVPRTDSYLANRYRAAQFAWDLDMAKIGKPNNRDLWGETAQTVNAGYEPTNNDITFPAAILQPPFFDVANDDALNYGAIGAIMGHEMTHGFDDQGRLYDAKGDQRNWWTPDDAKRFNARAKCISDFYDTLPVDATQNQKGALVLGEAIADLGGATIAFKTLERVEAGKPKTKIQGFTPEQRFFLAYANVWATNFRPEAAKLQANSDVHALDFNRVRGTVMNMPQFAKTWYCPLNAKMVRPPAKRCQIW